MHIESKGILCQAQLWCTSTFLLHKMPCLIRTVAKKDLVSPNDLNGRSFLNDVTKNNFAKHHDLNNWFYFIQFLLI